MTETDPVVSPCIGVCKINEDNLCVGCWRTLNEIAAWSGLDVATRQAIMQRLPERQKQHDRDAS